MIPGSAGCIFVKPTEKPLLAIAPPVARRLEHLARSGRVVDSNSTWSIFSEFQVALICFVYYTFNIWCFSRGLLLNGLLQYLWSRFLKRPRRGARFSHWKIRRDFDYFTTERANKINKAHFLCYASRGKDSCVSALEWIGQEPHCDWVAENMLAICITRT